MARQRLQRRQPDQQRPRAGQPHAPLAPRDGQRVAPGHVVVVEGDVAAAGASSGRARAARGRIEQVGRRQTERGQLGARAGSSGRARRSAGTSRSTLVICSALPKRTPRARIAAGVPAGQARAMRHVQRRSRTRRRSRPPGTCSGRAPRACRARRDRGVLARESARGRTACPSVSVVEDARARRRRSAAGRRATRASASSTRSSSRRSAVVRLVRRAGARHARRRRPLARRRRGAASRRWPIRSGRGDQPGVGDRVGGAGQQVREARAARAAGGAGSRARDRSCG